MSGMRHRQESGVAVVWGLVLVSALIGVASLCVAVVGLLVAHRQAQLGADLAALAGATALRDGGDPCRSAEQVATLNHGAVARCTVAADTVAVEVTVDVDGLVGLRHRLGARALAGPSGLNPAVPR